MLTATPQPLAKPQTEKRSAAAAEPGRYCPAAGILELLNRPWVPHIFWVLRHGPVRFGVLRRSIQGISARLLTVRLRDLESRGMVQRTVKPGKVPEVLYSPTSRLADLEEVMLELERVQAKWQDAPPQM